MKQFETYPALFWQQWQHQGSRQHDGQTVPEAHFVVPAVFQSLHDHEGVTDPCCKSLQCSLQALKTQQNIFYIADSVMQ